MIVLINKAAENYNKFAEVPIPLPLTEETTLISLDSVFDSLSLVTFLMEIEGLASEKFNKEINLMTGEALGSMDSIGELAKYLQEVGNASV